MIRMAFWRTGIIVVGALLITVIGSYASDSIIYGGGSQLAELMGVAPSVCPTGMVEVPTALTFACVDSYEASPTNQCPAAEPESAADTDTNLGAPNCQAGSVAGVLPWRYVNREQASRLCARAGKRLPSAREWYQFAIDTKEHTCNTHASLGKTGAATECTSAFRVYDTVGNVWEWVSDDVIEGTYNNRALPDSGYVTKVDSGGVATEVARESDAAYGEDYLWNNSVGSFGILRGGFYGGKADAGVYAVQAETPPNFSGEAVGFRCVR